MRQADELAQLAQDLERSNADLKKFAYVASHELQEPLNQVANYVQLLEMRYQEQLGDDAKEFINFAVEGVSLMQTLIDDVLAYSKVDLQGIEFQLTDVETALNRALTNLRGRIKETEAIVTYDELPTVLADSTQLMQLFQNLIGNAIKFRSDRRLLKKVLLIGKADNGKLECHLELLDLVALCRQIVAETQSSLNPKHQLIFTSTGESTVSLWDESLLRHILTNLLSNAIKYSPTGGIVQFDLTFQAQTVTLKIQDSGIGIPKEDCAKLFQPFHRAENTHKIPGTGLGLAIVKKCVEVHGGQTSVQSEIGVGTVFMATLPLLTSN